MEKIDKKVVNELMNADKLYADFIGRGGMKRPKNDLFEKSNDKLFTNDGREMLNERGVL